MNARKIFSLFAWILLSVPAWAEPELLVHSRQVRPSPDQMARWMRSYWPTEEEVWAFPDKRDAESVIRHREVPVEVQGALLASHFEMTPEERHKFGWQGNYQTHFLLKISPTLRDRLPESLVTRYVVYHRLEMKRQTLAPWNVDSEARWQAVVDEQRSRLSEDLFERFLRSSVLDGATHRVLVTPYSWKTLPTEAKQAFFESKFAPSPFREGLSVALAVRNETPASIAAWLSPSGLYSEEIARKIAAQRGQSEILLEELLPDTVTANLDRYSETHGPDCFGVAKAFARGTTKVEAIEVGAELIPSLELSGYSPVPAGTRLELGDILYYEDGRNGGIHASVYLAEGIVLTKNGSSRTYPTLLQLRSENEKNYSRDLRFRLSVFRFGASKIPAVTSPYFYAHPEEEFSHLFFNAQAGRWTRSNALSLIGLHPLSDAAEADLRRYAVDRRFNDTRAQAEAILLKHDESVAHESVAKRIGFLAYDHGEENVEALKKLALQDSLSSDELRFVAWVGKEWSYRYRHALRAISTAHDLGIPFTGVCRVVGKALGGLLP